MMNPSPLQAVEQFYDFHPISAEQIFSAVAARHIAREDITQAVLSAHDQDHYGGTDAVDRLMVQAAITADDHVLDVCAGMGGPARYIAWKTGCKVTGLDLTASRVAGAQALTEAARLGAQVDFVHGNALEMPFDPAQFTCIISQEAFAHIPHKRQLIGQCERALKPGGRMVFSDIMSHQTLSSPDAQQLYDGMRFSEIATLADYQHWFADVGMTGLDPDTRFDQHKANIKSNRFAHQYGLQLLPAIYQALNPMPYADAQFMEVDLAIRLREAGFGVWQA